MNKLPRILSGVLIGAFALCAAAPGQAAPGQAAPFANASLNSAVFQPGETDAAVQTVQYRRHFRPHYRGRGFGHRRVYPRRFYRPGRIYRAPGPIGRPGFAPGPLRRY